MTEDGDQLQAVYASADAWRRDYRRLESYEAFLRERTSRAVRDEENLLTVVRSMEDGNRLAAKLAISCKRNALVDNGNGAILDRVGAFRSLSDRLNETIDRIKSELATVEADELQQLVGRSEQLGRYEHHLEAELRPRRDRPKDLPKELTQFLDLPSLVNEVIVCQDADVRGVKVVSESAPLYLRRHLETTEDPAPISKRTIRSLLEVSDRNARANAYEGLHAELGQYKHALATVYAARVATSRIRARLGGYETPLQMTVEGRLSTEQVERVIDAVGEGIERYHRYLRLRQDALGVESLRDYDLRAPLFDPPQQSVPFDRIATTLCEAVEPLGAEYRSRLRTAFEENHVFTREDADPYANRGGTTMGGAGVTPRITMSYDGGARSALTLVHETGHYMHMTYNDEQLPVYAKTPKLAREVPSLFHEVLFTNHVLTENRLDVAFRRRLLATFLRRVSDRIFWQTQRIRFELAVTEQTSLRNDGLLSRLNAIDEALREEFQPMVSDDRTSRWLQYDPSSTGFERLPYLVGTVAGLVLGWRIADGRGVEKYFDFLRAGSNRAETTLFGDLGLPLDDEATTQEALRVYDGFLDSLASRVCCSDL